MYYIYKITKPTELMSIYIGKTEMTEWKINYFNNRKYKKYSDIEITEMMLKRRMAVHKIQVLNCMDNWFDDNCKIELIEKTEDSNRECELIKLYKTNNFDVKNSYVGDLSEDKQYRLWRVRCCQAAKEVNLTAKEFRNQHNIPHKYEDYIELSRNELIRIHNLLNKKKKFI